MNSIAKSVSNAVKLRVKNGNGSSSSTPPPSSPSVVSGKTTTTKSSSPPQLPSKPQQQQSAPPPTSRKPMSTKSCLTTTKKDDDNGGNKNKMVINENDTTNDQPKVRFHSSTNAEQSVDNGQIKEEEKVVVRMRNGYNNGRVQQKIANAIDNNAPIKKDNDADEAMTATLLARKSYYTEEIATVKDLLDKDVKLTPAIMEILYFSFRSKINCCRTNEEKRDVCLDGLALLNRIQIDAVDANFLLHHEETLFYCYRGLSAALCDESSRMTTWDTIASKYKQIFEIIDNSDQHELQPINNAKRLEIVHRYSWLCYYYCDVAGSESVEFCEKQAKCAKEIDTVALDESDSATVRLVAQRIGWIEQNIGNAKKRRRLSMALDISRFSQCLDI